MRRGCAALGLADVLAQEDAVVEFPHIPVGQGAEMPGFLAGGLLQAGQGGLRRHAAGQVGLRVHDVLGAARRIAKDALEGSRAELAIDGVLEAHAFGVGKRERFADIEGRLGEDREVVAGSAGVPGQTVDQIAGDLAGSAGFLGKIGPAQPGGLAFDHRLAGGGLLVAIGVLNEFPERVLLVGQGVSQLMGQGEDLLVTVLVESRTKRRFFL